MEAASEDATDVVTHARATAAAVRRLAAQDAQIARCMRRKEEIWRVHADQGVKGCVEAAARLDVVLDVRGNACYVLEHVVDHAVVTEDAQPLVLALALDNVPLTVSVVLVHAQDIVMEAAVTDAPVVPVVPVAVGVVGAVGVRALVQDARHAVDAPIHAQRDVRDRVMRDVTMDVNLHACHRALALVLRIAPGNLLHQRL